MTPQMVRRAYALEDTLLERERQSADNLITIRQAQCYNLLADTLAERTERRREEIRERYDREIKPLREGRHGLGKIRARSKRA